MLVQNRLKHSFSLPIGRIVFRSLWFVVLFSAAIATNATLCLAQDDWSLLHTIEIDPSKASQDIAMPQATSPSRAVRLELKSGNLRLNKVMLLYRNGQIHVNDYRNQESKLNGKPVELNAGDQTEPIDCRALPLTVDQITLNYEVVQQAEAATVEIWGQERGSDTTDSETCRANAVQNLAAAPSEPTLTEDEVVASVNRKATALIRTVRVSWDGKYLAVGDDKGIVRLLDFARFELLQTINAHTKRVRDLDFGPDNKMLVTVGEDGFIRFWNIETGKKMDEDELKELEAPQGSIPYSGRYNPQKRNRKYMLIGDKSGKLIAWELVNRRRITNRKFHEGPIYAVGYQPDGSGTFFSAGADGKISVRLPQGERKLINAHKGAVWAAGYSASGDLLFSAGSDRKVRIWNTETYSSTPIAELDGHLKYILTADISKNSNYLASGGGDKAVNVYDIKKKELIARLKGHTADIEAVIFTPDEQFVVSASEDRSVRVWSVESAEELIRLYFGETTDKYVGITMDQQYFGDSEPGFITVYVNGRLARDQRLGATLSYLGKAVSLVAE